MITKARNGSVKSIAKRESIDSTRRKSDMKGRSILYSRFLLCFEFVAIFIQIMTSKIDLKVVSSLFVQLSERSGLVRDVKTAEQFFENRNNYKVCLL